MKKVLFFIYCCFITAMPQLNLAMGVGGKIANAARGAKPVGNFIKKAAQETGKGVAERVITNKVTGRGTKPQSGASGRFPQRLPIAVHSNNDFHARNPSNYVEQQDTVTAYIIGTQRFSARDNRYSTIDLEDETEELADVSSESLPEKEEELSVTENIPQRKAQELASSDVHAPQETVLADVMNISGMQTGVSGLFSGLPIEFRGTFRIPFNKQAMQPQFGIERPLTLPSGNSEQALEMLPGAAQPEATIVVVLPQQEPTQENMLQPAQDMVDQVANMAQDAPVLFITEEFLKHCFEAFSQEGQARITEITEEDDDQEIEVPQTEPDEQKNQEQPFLSNGVKKALVTAASTAPVVVPLFKRKPSGVIASLRGGMRTLGNKLGFGPAKPLARKPVIMQNIQDIGLGTRNTLPKRPIATQSLVPYQKPQTRTLPQVPGHIQPVRPMQPVRVQSGTVPQVGKRPQLITIVRSADKKKLITTVVSEDILARNRARLPQFLRDWNRSGYVVIMNNNTMNTLVDAMQERFEPIVQQPTIPALVGSHPELNQDLQDDENEDISWAEEDRILPEDQEDIVMGPWIDDEPDQEHLELDGQEDATVSIKHSSGQTIPARRPRVQRQQANNDKAVIDLPKGITFKKPKRQKQEAKQKEKAKNKEEKNKVQEPQDIPAQPVPTEPMVTSPETSAVTEQDKPVQEQPKTKKSLFNKDDFKKDIEAMRQAFEDRKNDWVHESDTTAPPVPEGKPIEGIKQDDSAQDTFVKADAQKNNAPMGVYRIDTFKKDRQSEVLKKGSSADMPEDTSDIGVIWPLLLLLWQWLIQAGTWFLYTKKVR